jgi:hypothetical protein
MCSSVHLQPNLVNACLPKGYTFRSNSIKVSETHSLCSIHFSTRRMIFETLKNEGMSTYSNLEDTEQPTVVLIAYFHLLMCTQKSKVFVCSKWNLELFYIRTYCCIRIGI